MRKSNRKQTRVKGREDRRVVEFFVKHGQFLLPMIEMVEQSSAAIDELIDVVGRGAVEAVLEMSAQQLTGAKSQGRQTERADGVRWHGRQRGSVRLSDRKLRVARPRLRGHEGEVTIPAYAALQDDERMSARMLELLLSGVSTRDYQKVIREMADTAGVSKSSVSREFVAESAEKLQELNERNLPAAQLLIIYLDGMVYGEHHVLGAVGIDSQGFKHALGIRLGSSENAVVAKDLLAELVARGLDPEVIGDYAVVQRCRTHKLRNVLSYLPQHLQDQVAAVIRAAYKLPYKDGLARLKTQAAWLQKEHPQAAASLLEGLEETFTVNRLGLTATLMKCLTTTNIIENPNGTVRRQTRRVSRWQDGTMVLRWAASAFLNAEKKFRRVSGFRELWMLENALKALLIDNQPVAGLAREERAA